MNGIEKTTVEQEGTKILYAHRYAVSPFSPEYLDLTSNPSTITSLVTPNQFLHISDKPEQISKSAEGYAVSPFQINELRIKYPGAQLYSYNIVIPLPHAEIQKIRLVEPHNLATRIEGSLIRTGEYNGIFFPDKFFNNPEVLRGLKVSVSKINQDGTLGEERLINFQK